MEILSIENFSFTYPAMSDGAPEKRALKDINISLDLGSFNLLCGLSASGKTSLLRQIKPSMAAHGKREGRILLGGRDIYDLSQREDAERIGFVQQNPKHQAVTDKVWHELAFGLESLGLDSQDIRLKVGELASFFNMEAIFERDINTLSGGQLQMTNLASVLAMQPEILILDEPTSQLDPIGARDFFAALKRINEELGTTIFISEHRLGSVFPLADQVFFLKDGVLAYQGRPEDFGSYLLSQPDPILDSLPEPARIYAGVEKGGKTPLTVKEGRRWLASLELDQAPDTDQEGATELPDPLIEMREVFFRYSKEGADVLKNFKLKIYPGKIHCIFGGNGAGKSTALRILSGLDLPTRGRVYYKGKKRGRSKDPLPGLMMVPQDPRVFFSKKTVREELEELGQDKDRAQALAETFEISQLADSHPYDISGGEQQRLAIAKVLMAQPEILVLDEPTKGMDGAFKNKFKGILEDLVAGGMTIIIAGHDLEFSSLVGDLFYLLFNGEVISQGRGLEFFKDNYFYTTDTNKICRPWKRDLVRSQDAVRWILDEKGKKA